VLAGALLVPGTYLWLDAQQQERAVAWANAAVAEKVQAAEALLAAEKWDQAVLLLQEALATDHATDLEKAGRLLGQAQRYQAYALLDAAELALRRHDAGRAMEHLQAYLAHPKAGDTTRAVALKNALELATSDARAVALLQQLPDGALAALAEQGDLPAVARLSDPRVQPIHRDTLARHLDQELARRAQVRRRQDEESRAALLAAQRQQEETARRAREERERREARIRSTPVFRELTDFTALTRQSHAQPEATLHERTLRRYLFRVLRINDRKEQRALLEEPADRQEGKTPLAEKISIKRANFKERFRSYQGFDPTDWQLFDRAVDQALDQLLADVQGSEPF
jgi:hypothetical protein